MEIVKIRVCVDCLHIIANGETSEPFDYEQWERDVKANWPPEDGWHLGLGWSEEEDGEDHDQAFSWSSCKACGSQLGGDRFNAHAAR
jgi:hypothetical protein